MFELLHNLTCFALADRSRPFQAEAPLLHILHFLPLPLPPLLSLLLLLLLKLLRIVLRYKNQRKPAPDLIE